jgi:hypothetical protein
MNFPRKSVEPGSSDGFTEYSNAQWLSIKACSFLDLLSDFKDTCWFVTPCSFPGVYRYLRFRRPCFFQLTHRWCREPHDALKLRSTWTILRRIHVPDASNLDIHCATISLWRTPSSWCMKWLFFFTLVPCILILSESFIYQLMHESLICFEKNIKICIKTAPTCFGAITIIRERIT